MSANCHLINELLHNPKIMINVWSIFFIPVKVCSGWRNIALTLRDKVFGDDEEHLIDIHDVQVRRCTIFYNS